MSKDKTPDEEVIGNYLWQKALDLGAANKSCLDKRASINLVKDLVVARLFIKSLKNSFSKGWVAPPKYSGKRIHSPHKRIVNILLSDLHFGSFISSDECPVAYNTIQESRRLGRVALQVADYKRQYRKETKLIVHLLGDIIQGQLHDPRDGEPLAIQFTAAVHYLTQLIMFWTSQYPSVEIYCTPGNHGRNMSRHPDRAVQQKFDSIETMVYVAVKTAVLNSGISNCKFIIPKTPYYTVELFNSKLFGTHGDTVLKPGFPGRAINVSNLEKQVYKWNAAKNIGGPFDIFAVGHVHTASSLPGNISMITNGALVPPDAFSLSIGSPDNTCGQYLFESVEGHAIGDQRFIVVDSADNNSQYNDIIKPFSGL
jgi:hypothetical protein